MSKPNAEITLDFKAEYKQALVAIANLQKALDALQKTATPLFNAGNITPFNFNSAEVTKFKDALIQAGKGIAGVSAELANYGKAWQTHGINQKQSQDVANLAQNYLTLATSINNVVTALNQLGGAQPGNPPQLQPLQQQIQLLQQQINQLQQQLQQVQQQQQNTPPGAPPNAPNSPLNNNVRTMTWLQQANAARRLSQEIQDLGKQFSNLAEDAANGNLNLTDMIGKMAMLGYYMKGAMGKATALLLVVEALQNIWNTYAKGVKRAADAEAYMQETMKISQKAYKAAAAAKKEYLKAEERKNEILALKGQYAELNNELQKGLSLIQQSTNAEIARLALTEDEAQHAMTLKKAELGRQLTSGQISQDEYETTLIELSKQGKIRKAKGNVSRAEAKAKEAEAQLDSGQADYAEKSRLANEKQDILERYLSEEEIKALQQGSDSLRQRAEDKKTQMLQVEKKLKQITDENILISAAKGLVSVGEFPLEVKSLYDEYQALKAEYENAVSASLDYDTMIEEKTGTDNLKDYQARRKQAQESYDIAKGQRDSAGNKLEATAKEYEEARLALEAARKESAQEIKQAQEYAESELETMRVKTEERKKQAERDKQYRELQKQLSDMTSAEIRKAQAAIQEALSDPQSGIDHKTRAQFQRIDALYSDTLSSRKEAGAQTVQEVRNAAKGEKGNQVTRWAEANVEKYATSPLTAKQADKLIEQGTQALRTQSKVDDEMIAAILNQATVTEQVTNKQREQLRALKQQLQRQNRAMLQSL